MIIINNKNTIKMKSIFNYFVFAFATVAMLVSCKEAEKTEYEKLAEVVDADSTVLVLKEQLPSNNDTVSYYLGLYLGDMIKDSGLAKDHSELNLSILQEAVKDAISAPYPKSADDQAFKSHFDYDPYKTMMYLNDYTIKKQQYQAQFNKVLGEKYMEANKAKEGVMVSESELQYQIHVEGEGDKVKMEDEVAIKYEGRLIDGTVFDSNDSLAMMAGRFVPGFSEGLCLLSKGGKATLVIPSDLAYGQRAPQQIGPNSTLIFEVEILDIIKPVVEEVVAAE